MRPLELTLQLLTIISLNEDPDKYRARPTDEPERREPGGRSTEN